MSTFTLYIKRKCGRKDDVDKAILRLKGFLGDVVKETTSFDGADVIHVEDGNTPSLLKTDVIVYLVKNPEKGVIAAQKGDVGLASGGTVLGLTDCNKKICEVYWDRLYEPNPVNELAGACYHEAAHVKSNQGNSMHSDKDGFLKASPDYAGSPTEKNDKFLAQHLGKELSMNASY